MRARTGAANPKHRGRAKTYDYADRAASRLQLPRAKATEPSPERSYPAHLIVAPHSVRLRQLCIAQIASSLVGLSEVGERGNGSQEKHSCRMEPAPHAL
jgi:hypothetical protein